MIRTNVAYLSSSLLGLLCIPVERCSVGRWESQKKGDELEGKAERVSREELESLIFIKRLSSKTMEVDLKEAD